MGDDQLKAFVGNLPHDATPSDIDTILLSAGIALEEVRCLDSPGFLFCHLQMSSELA